MFKVHNGVIGLVIVTLNFPAQIGKKVEMFTL